VTWGRPIPPDERPDAREFIVVHTWRRAWWVHRQRRLAGELMGRLRTYEHIHIEVGQLLVIRWPNGPHGERRWTHAGVVLGVDAPATRDPFKRA
jgi:hypothetical protein